MAGISTTAAISFQIVKAHFIAMGGGVHTSLSALFANALAGGFNPAHEGSKDRLTNFKGYYHFVPPAYFNVEYCFAITPFFDVNDDVEMAISVKNTGSLYASKSVSGTWKTGSTTRGTDTETCSLNPGSTKNYSEYFVVAYDGQWTFILDTGDETYTEYFDVNATGGGECFVAGTQIKLATGAIVPIESLTVGMKLASVSVEGMPESNDASILLEWEDQSPEFTPIDSEILAITESKEPTLSFNDGLIEASPNHIQLVKRMGYWVFSQFKRIRNGDEVLDSFGNTHVITSRKFNPIVQPVYKISLKDNHLFYANDILTHNRKIPL